MIARLPGLMPGVLLAALCATVAHAQDQQPLRVGAFEAVSRRVMPAVVTIEAETDRMDVAGFLGPALGGTDVSSGSGIVFAAEGLILTNHHVVEQATRIEVELSDGTRHIATLRGSDPATDLAVLEIPRKDLTPARFGDSDAVRPGQWVAALGAPFGLRQTVTVGVISATGRVVTDQPVGVEYLQTDARINPGSSGGPLVDLEGAVLGINSRIQGQASGIGFAVASNLARKVAQQLASQGRVTRGWIGVEVQSLTPAIARHLGHAGTGGVLVTRVRAGSPGEAARIAPGDLLMSVDARTLEDAGSFQRVVAEAAKGASLDIRLRRGAKTYKAVATVGAEPAVAVKPGHSTPARYADAATLGLGVRGVSQETAAEFGYAGAGQVIIVRVAASSPAERAGLVPGLAVLRADGRAVRKPRDLLTAFGDGKALLLLEDREGHAAFVLVAGANH